MDRETLLEQRAALALKRDRAAAGVTAAMDTAAAALAVLEERLQHTHAEVQAGRLDEVAAAAALAPLLAQVEAVEAERAALAQVRRCFVFLSRVSCPVYVCTGVCAALPRLQLPQGDTTRHAHPRVSTPSAWCEACAKLQCGGRKLWLWVGAASAYVRVLCMGVTAVAPHSCSHLIRTSPLTLRHCMCMCSVDARAGWG